MQLSPTRFRFLNAEREILTRADWNAAGVDKLWLYNLHYFDDLNAAHALARSAWHRTSIEKWIADNPPGKGNGWEPYTLSLRIVNWVKWALAGNALTPAALHSLAVQCRYLRRRLEHHLLGNHLFANAKALVFAGLFFEGPEADAWRRTGLDILRREVPEQVLPDGGHFERSPMYHAIILEDLLDLLNVFELWPHAVPPTDVELTREWRGVTAGMLSWLRVMTHPDGDIALFNDAAFGVAATPVALHAYAQRLGIAEHAAGDALVHLKNSGYVRLAVGTAVMFADVGEIGPAYLPGHAHADTLSFELSVAGQRVIVDSGTSCYETGVERLRQRSTSAHNTVEINGESSSEVWGSFRVARRAHPRDLDLQGTGGRFVVRCAHDGYRRLPGKPLHRREWTLQDGALTIVDSITAAADKAVARFHFHPECRIVQLDPASGEIEMGTQGILRWSVKQGRAHVRESTYHPEFGTSLPNKSLDVELVATRAEVVLEWDR